MKKILKLIVVINFFTLGDAYSSKAETGSNVILGKTGITVIDTQQVEKLYQDDFSTLQADYNKINGGATSTP